MAAVPYIVTAGGVIARSGVFGKGPERDTGRTHRPNTRFYRIRIIIAQSGIKQVERSVCCGNLYPKSGCVNSSQIRVEFQEFPNFPSGLKTIVEELPASRNNTSTSLSGPKRSVKTDPNSASLMRWCLPQNTASRSLSTCMGKSVISILVAAYWLRHTRNSGRRYIPEIPWIGANNAEYRGITPADVGSGVEQGIHIAVRTTLPEQLDSRLCDLRQATICLL